MKSLPARVAPLVLACACDPATSRAEPTPSAEPSPQVPMRELGLELGGSVVAHAPSPGRWASEFDFDVHRFVTMEHTVESRIRGRAVMTLEPDGSMRACFGASTRDQSDLGHLQARDGEDHHFENEHGTLSGFEGRWLPVDHSPEIEVRLERQVWRRCAVGGPEATAVDLRLRCFVAKPNSALPRESLVCTLPVELTPALPLALVVGNEQHVLAWAFRSDPATQAARAPAQAEPLVLLGRAPGLSLRIEDSDRDGLPISVRSADVADPG